MAKKSKNYWKSYHYQKNKELGKQLQNHDRQIIAECTGFTTYYVHMVLRGVRHNDKVVEAAKKLVVQRMESNYILFAA